MTFAFYYMTDVVRVFFFRGGMVLISEILNEVKHVKSPLWGLAHSRCSRNTGSLPTYLFGYSRS